MTQSSFALLFSFLFIMTLSSPQAALAQTPATTAPATPGATATGVAPLTGTLTAPATPAAPEAPKSPWRLSYYTEYQGPRFSNIDFTKTQGVTDAEPSYTSVFHQVKLGYGISKAVIFGTAIRANSYFDPKKDFGFLDLRFYSSWNHMIETQDLDMQGVLTLELPTTDSNRNAGKLFAVKAGSNWTLKTSLRNWSFTAATEVKSVFFNDPAGKGGKTDITIAIYPYITVDLSANTQLLFEASFDANHNYNAAFYDYQPGDPDYIDVGPNFAIGSHISTNIAFRFFTDSISFKTACLFANFGWAL